MFLAVRFLNELGDRIDEKDFQITGDSLGWTGSPNNSPLIHRHEKLIVPPNATRIMVVLSSAGPPATVGIYAIANLVVTSSSDILAPMVLLQSPYDHALTTGTNAPSPKWIRDGTHLSMARALEVNGAAPIHLLAIEDNDTTAHAEWRTTLESSPLVAQGDQISIEWNEMYSVGVGDLRSLLYYNLPSGSYKFHVTGVDFMGNQTGIEASLNVQVPEHFWKRPSFWIALLILTVVIIAIMARYWAWRRVQSEMLHLRNQQMLERERLRIAHDIHDDLGARVTQISLVSAMFLNDVSLPERARAGFTDIKTMSQDLVSALYETVWAVNPEYDNLAELADYICQMVNQLCERTQLRCRLQVQDLPSEVQISSQVRHNIVMVIKEAIHNIIKHAKATEVSLHVAFAEGVLDFSIQDNGCGFGPDGTHLGHGLKNMQQRIQNIQGTCAIDSRSGHGTTVHVRIIVNNLPIESKRAF